ncbi:TetR family transcriptional regulator [Geomicrobium sp. JCM 19055]|uniref:TetR family transcriptional regulator n=1 Tax=Geomicrobium sp. JCM 19055 TaxID=1460649 RepID=UPI0009DF7369
MDECRKHENKRSGDYSRSRPLYDTRYNGTSVRAVADKAKVNVALISYYFGGKKRSVRNDFK